MLRDALGRRLRDGEVLIVDRSGAAPFLKISLEDSLDLRYGRPGVGGVSVDSRWRPVKYHFIYNRGNLYNNAEPDLEVPADKVIHIFERESPKQLRGLSDVYVASPYLDALDDYRGLFITGARRRLRAASVLTYTKDEAAARAKKAAQDRVVSGVRATYAGGDQEAEINSILNAFADVGIVAMPDGNTIEFNDSAFEPRNVAEYTAIMLKMVARALGVSYAELTGDTKEANFSSLKHASVTGRQFYLDRRAEMSTLVKQVLWMWIIKRQSADEDLRFQAAATNFNPILQYPQLPDYDQSKTMDVYRAQLTMQVISPQMVIRELGRDPEEVARQIDEWQQVGLEPSRY